MSIIKVSSSPGIDNLVECVQSQGIILNIYISEFLRNNRDISGSLQDALIDRLSRILYIFNKFLVEKILIDDKIMNFSDI